MEKNIILESGDYSSSFNQYIYNEVPAGSECLDVGCWTGNVGKSLIGQKDCIVDGLDCKAEVLEVAIKNGYRETFLVNLNNESFDLNVINKMYQVILFADVLEHLINPVEVLSAFMDHVAANGRVIISLPNVAFILNRMRLLFGQWEYKDFGTLDKTHLKFFTIDSAVKMVQSAGLIVVKVMPYNQFGILRYIKPLKVIFPRLFAYQTLIVAKR